MRQVVESAMNKGILYVPKSMNRDAFLMSCFVTLTDTPALLQCEAKSLLKAMGISMNLRFHPGKILGQSWFIPRKKWTGSMEIQECNYQNGYRGLFALNSRAVPGLTLFYGHILEGDGISFNPMAMNPNDVLRVETIRPSISDEERKIHKGTWVMFRPPIMPNGSIPFPSVEYWTKEMLDNHYIKYVQKFNKTTGKYIDSDAWKVTGYGGMCVKTVMSSMSRKFSQSIENLALGYANAIDIAGELMEPIPPAPPNLMGDGDKSNDTNTVENADIRSEITYEPPVESAPQRTMDDVLGGEADDELNLN
jgi:recombinational DNA repair protein RecT